MGLLGMEAFSTVVIRVREGAKISEEQPRNNNAAWSSVLAFKPQFKSKVLPHSDFPIVQILHPYVTLQTPRFGFMVLVLQTNVSDF